VGGGKGGRRLRGGRVGGWKGGEGGLGKGGEGER